MTCRSTLVTNHLRANEPGDLAKRAAEARAQLEAAKEETCVHRQHGRRLGIAVDLTTFLERHSTCLRKLINDESNELRDRLVDELADTMAEDWGPMVSADELARHISREWRKALEHSLPECLAYWVWDLLEEVVPPERIAAALADRIYAEHCEEVEVEYDPTPDPDHVKEAA